MPVDPHPELTFLPAKANPLIDREAARLKKFGWTYDQIAEHLNLGDDPLAALAAVRRSIAAAMTSRMVIDEKRYLESLQLDELEAMAWGMLRESHHPLVQQGKLVLDQDGESIDDKRLRLEVLDRIMRIKERRAKMEGLDAPTRMENHLSMDVIDAEISRLRLELEPGSGDEVG